jgi:hypothetical protein
MECLELLRQLKQGGGNSTGVNRGFDEDDGGSKSELKLGSFPGEGDFLFIRPFLGDATLTQGSQTPFSEVSKLFLPIRAGMATRQLRRIVQQIQA